jgi:predicted RNA binding protein YcfA (HicA-like mRNA interferase family)
MKLIDIDKSIYELTSKYPELIEILKEIGFKDVGSPLMLKTAGKVMTIPKGCKMKGFELAKVIENLKENGFEVTGGKGVV